MTIDGVEKDAIDLYCACSTPLRQQSYYFYNLGSGTHTIHIVNSGTKNANSGGYFIDIDKLVPSN